VDVADSLSCSTASNLLLRNVEIAPLTLCYPLIALLSGKEKISI